MSVGCCGSAKSPHGIDLSDQEEKGQETKALIHDEKTKEKEESDDIPCAVKVFGGCSFCVLLLMGIVFFGLKQYLSQQALQKMLYIDDADMMFGNNLTAAELVVKNWWPGCYETDSIDDFTKTCAEPCYSPDLMKKIWEFNKANPGEVVYYPSRTLEGIEQAKLGGWLLPAPRKSKLDTAARPRIVLQHGFTENSNKFRQTVGAYLLRELGYDVLLNNFRDHGYSSRSKAHVYEWGHSYPLDVLGALDYLRSDPAGKLGGKISSKQVGLMGFSKGAFTVLNSFGMDGDVPGAWVDSPPWMPKIVFANGAMKVLEGMGLGFMAGLLVDGAWDTVLSTALSKGIDLQKHLPKDSLLKGPDTKRLIYGVANMGDTTVPISQHTELKGMLDKYPEKYSPGYWVNNGTCKGNDHCIDHLERSDVYKTRLCTFWSKVFELPSGDCAP